MAHSRALAPALAPSTDALTADMVGIGMLVGGEGSRDPNIEDTLLFASVEGMERDDLRVLAVLVTWFGVHSSRVNADRLTRLVALQESKRIRAFWSALAHWRATDRRFARLARSYRGSRIDLLTTGTDFQVRRHGEDPRFTGLDYARRPTSCATGRPTCSHRPNSPRATRPTAGVSSSGPPTGPTCGPRWSTSQPSRPQRWRGRPTAPSPRPGRFGGTSPRGGAIAVPEASMVRAASFGPMQVGLSRCVNHGSRPPGRRASGWNADGRRTEPCAITAVRAVSRKGTTRPDDELQPPGTTKGPQVALEALAKPAESGAGNRIRTGDPQLGKLMLYQLSYSRVAATDLPRYRGASQGVRGVRRGALESPA